MKKLILFFISSLLLGCEQQAATPAPATASSVSATDFAGNSITLPQPAKRIVALAPHVVENVYTAGAGAQLVGVVAYSDYPEAAKALPLVGGYAKTNLEKILELDPDLIISWESGNSDASVARIKELGYPVYIDQPHTLNDLAKSVRDIGRLTGHFETANKSMTAYLQNLNALTKANEDKRTVTAFYQVWNSPLQTINGSHIISDAIKRCGGENIYANETAIAPIINIESILERNPEVIIASGMSAARPEWLDDWKQWQTLTAVKQDNLFFVHPDHIQRHTTRILLGIKAICEQLDIARGKTISNEQENNSD